MKTKFMLAYLLIALTIGVVIGIFIGAKNIVPSFKSANDEDLFSYNSFNRDKNDSLVILRKIGDSIYKRHHITPDSANLIMSNYLNYDKKFFNTSLHTGEIDPSTGNDHLRFFFIPKPLLDTIFSMSPKDIGIRLWVAKEKDDNKRIFTFAIVGVKQLLSKDKLGKKTFTTSNDTSYFNYVDTCPKNCGN